MRPFSQSSKCSVSFGVAWIVIHRGIIAELDKVSISTTTLPVYGRMYLPSRVLYAYGMTCLFKARNLQFGMAFIAFRMHESSIVIGIGAAANMAGLLRNSIR